MTTFKNTAEARRYVWKCLATTLSNDIANGADYLDEERFDEFDDRRLERAAKQVLNTLRKRAGG